MYVFPFTETLISKGPTGAAVGAVPDSMISPFVLFIQMFAGSRVIEPSAAVALRIVTPLARAHTLSAPFTVNVSVVPSQAAFP